MFYRLEKVIDLVLLGQIYQGNMTEGCCLSIVLLFKIYRG